MVVVAMMMRVPGRTFQVTIWQLQVVSIQVMRMLSSLKSQGSCADDGVENMEGEEQYESHIMLQNSIPHWIIPMLDRKR